MPCSSCQKRREARLRNTEMVKVKFVDLHPTGVILQVGMTNYGFRKNGDVLKMFKTDFEKLKSGAAEIVE
jgi:hypothetical protein